MITNIARGAAYIALVTLFVGVLLTFADALPFDVMWLYVLAVACIGAFMLAEAAAPVREEQRT